MQHQEKSWWCCTHTGEWRSSRGRGVGRGGAERVRPYLVKTVADAAELRRELAGRTDDGLEKALGDLQKVPLVLLQVLALFQPGKGRHRRFGESALWWGGFTGGLYRRLTWWDPPRS